MSLIAKYFVGQTSCLKYSSSSAHQAIFKTTTTSAYFCIYPSPTLVCLWSPHTWLEAIAAQDVAGRPKYKSFPSFQKVSQSVSTATGSYGHENWSSLLWKTRPLAAKPNIVLFHTNSNIFFFKKNLAVLDGWKVEVLEILRACKLSPGGDCNGAWPFCVLGGLVVQVQVMAFFPCVTVKVRSCSFIRAGLLSFYCKLQQSAPRPGEPG